MVTTSTSRVEYLKTIGLTNNGDNGRGFANPYSLATSKDGRIFVLNRCDSFLSSVQRIAVVTIDDKHLLDFSKGHGSDEGQFIQPVGIAFDSKDRLHVTDEYNNRVVVFDSDGKYLHQWGTFGNEHDQLNGSSGIAIDTDDNIYIVNQYSNKINKFTSSGKYITHWGETGNADGQFNMPWGVDVSPNGHVYVADWRNDRIQKFTSDGEFLNSFGKSGTRPGEFHRPSGVVVDSDDNIYVTDWGNERLQVLNSDGTPRQVLRGQATLSQWAIEFFASNPDEQTTRDMSNLTPDLPPHLNTPYDISSQIEQYFWGPVALHLDKNGRLYVVESSRHRFQVYQIQNK